MYTVTILENPKKILRTYKHITKITYVLYGEEYVLEGDSIASHSFTFAPETHIHFYSGTGNYTVSGCIIGTLEIEKES